MKSLQDHWNSYEKLFINDDISYAEKLRIMSAFYFSAGAMMSVPMELNKNIISEEEALKSLKDILNEYQIFRSRL